MIIGLCKMLLQHCSHQRFMSVHWKDYWVVNPRDRESGNFAKQNIYSV